MTALRRPPSFGFCALQYLMIWLRKEKALHAQMRDGLAADGIRHSLAHFQVARNFPGIGTDHRKLSDLRQAIERADAKVDDPVRCVADLAASLKKDFGKNLLSAASKLLWLRHRSPFIIYDSRAVAALGFKPSGIGYAEYWECWHSAYRERKPAIKAATNTLGELHDSVRLLVPEWASKEVSGRWFAERVFDRYLWMNGRTAR